MMYIQERTDHGDDRPREEINHKIAKLSAKEFDELVARISRGNGILSPSGVVKALLEGSVIHTNFRNFRLFAEFGAKRSADIASNGPFDGDPQ